MTVQLLRNANVEVSQVKSGGSIAAHIVVDDKFEHTFLPTSRVSRHLDMMSTDELGSRLSGGQYFFHDEQLMDFRDGAYNGFVHTDQSIAQLMKTIGINQVSARRMRDFEMGKVWSRSEFNGTGSVGGEMQSQINFMWNPFVSVVKATFELVRLICENGMVGTTQIYNGKIPLVNRWDEHLDIASDQIQGTIADLVTHRLSEMVIERASIYEAQRALAHVTMRKSTGNGAHWEGLNNLSMLINPEEHLNTVYAKTVFTDPRLGKQMPSHLTTFDLYNVITEMRSHTNEVDGSSGLSLDTMANDIIFSTSRPEFESSVQRYSGKSAKLASFSDADQAFFNIIH
jgi:hypothetical protein